MIADKSAFYWDISTAKVIRRIQAHAHRINSVAINEESTLIFTASYDRTIAIWDLRSNAREAIQILNDATDSMTSLTISGSLIISGSVDGCLRTYDIRAGKVNEDSIRDPITCVRLTNDNKCAICTCIGGVIRLVSLSTGQILQEYSGGHVHESFKLESCAANDDCHIVSCSEGHDGYFVHYNLVSGAVVSQTRTADSNSTSLKSLLSVSGTKLSPALSSLCYHPSKPILLTASYDGSVKVWDCSSIQAGSRSQVS